ncbi:hypothetical protein SpAn4DRAFT_3118 [Sporomusa ovata]|uniref:Uncharacterized protein n=1 Tax=Sporomusa ovata TaxID=2378 RepID=A0A0U1KZ21_9FIRM|nr:hypothetical protein SpAn4DRAFT_3118 [Sporomusa ovata]
MGDNQSKVMVLSTKVLDDQCINAREKKKSQHNTGIFIHYREN